MGGYVKIIDGNDVYEGKILKLLEEDQVQIQLLNGRIVTLDSKEVSITAIGDDN